MDCGYSWATGMYMPSKEFNTDFYTTQAAFQLASYPTICLMLGSEKRSRLAGAYARAVKQCLTYNPTSKPDYRTIKGMVLADEELQQKGFIGILLLNIIVGLISKVIVDWIWNNWTETPNGEAGDGERRQ